MNKEYFEKIKEKLLEKEIDAIFIAPSEDLKLLLGYSPLAISRFQGLIIKSNGEIFYICNLLNVDEMREKISEKITIHSWNDGEDYSLAAKEVFEENGLLGKKFLVNSTTLAKHIIEISEKMNIKFVSEDKFLNDLRVIKKEDELEKLKISSQITDASFEEILKYIKPGLTELEIKNKLKEIIAEKGGISRNPLVCFGKNTAFPHYSETNGILQTKDIILMDFGCIYKGYHSDMTRTIFIGGITEEEKEVYEIVLNANLKGIEKIKENIEMKEIDNCSREYIRSKGYGEYFTTRLGHGLGLSVHEEPEISSKNNRKVEKGMVFTIEPGIYIKDKFGIRIEDAVAVTEKGTEILNNSTKNIIIL